MGAPGSCAPRTGTRPRLYVAGAPWDTSPLPKLSQGPLGSGRIRPDVLTTSENIQLAPAALWDDALKQRCFATTFDDGKVYCAPTTVTNPPSNLFKDSGCTTKIIMATCGQKFVTSGTLTCSDVKLDHCRDAARPVETLDEYWDNSTGTCLKVTPIAPVSAQPYLAPSTVAATFGELKRFIE